MNDHLQSIFNPSVNNPSITVRTLRTLPGTLACHSLGLNRHSPSCHRTSLRTLPGTLACHSLGLNRHSPSCHRTSLRALPGTLACHSLGLNRHSPSCYRTFLRVFPFAIFPLPAPFPQPIILTFSAQNIIVEISIMCCDIHNS